ncbi:hypothetical protein GCM10017557_37810 [Streptomyces aurantiacus]|uniref:Uncharacterized protein n=1 Tax=Streptomyces aurantiacus TaxID=47760 RepID=A0A7G1P1N7_9ACTN|nr:hypothetical protein GCM10017557_37810 [Streptomyces aurantiacus]
MRGHQDHAGRQAGHGGPELVVAHPHSMHGWGGRGGSGSGTRSVQHGKTLFSADVRHIGPTPEHGPRTREGGGEGAERETERETVTEGEGECVTRVSFDGLIRRAHMFHKFAFSKRTAKTQKLYSIVHLHL